MEKGVKSQIYELKYLLEKGVIGERGQRKGSLEKGVKSQIYELKYLSYIFET